MGIEWNKSWQKLEVLIIIDVNIQSQDPLFSYRTKHHQIPINAVKLKIFRLKIESKNSEFLTEIYTNSHFSTCH